MNNTYNSTDMILTNASSLQSLTNKNILVTGVTGVIGINLVNRLVELGSNVTSLSRKHKSYVPSVVRQLVMDLRDYDSVCKAISKNFDFVFLCDGKILQV
mgnify:CR=1 FL=1